MRAEGAPEVKAHDVRVAACALFIEMASIDGEFTPAELDGIISILKREFDLSEEYARQLIDKAKEDLDGSTDLWQFTNLINENFSNDEKIHVVELLWQIVYTDGKLDKHEDYLVHKLAKMLRLTHSQLINAKLKAIKPR
jgi:uncharacterized tellurite resistance protein B-like protein